MNKLIRLLTIFVGMLLPLTFGFAQGYPTKPITLVVGFGPGGNADIVARMLVQKMPDSLGQPVIVENRGGAGGLLANDSVAKAPPDGYRLSLISGAFTAQAAVLPKLPFDPQKDFTWVSTLISYPLVVVVPAESPHKTLDDLIKFAQVLGPVFGDMGFVVPGSDRRGLNRWAHCAAMIGAIEQKFLQDAGITGDKA